MLSLSITVGEGFTTHGLRHDANLFSTTGRVPLLIKHEIVGISIRVGVSCHVSCGMKVGIKHYTYRRKVYRIASKCTPAVSHEA